MNCYTRKEKIAMAIEDLVTKVKIAVEVTVIIYGVIALIALGFMGKRITELETQLENYEMQEEMQQESDEYIVVRDSMTGEVIYSGWK